MKDLSLRSVLLGLDMNDDDGANDISMCITFANSGPLPLILSHALFEGELLSDITACISFYLLLWSPLFWSFGKVILGLNKGTHDNNEESFVDGIRLFLNPPVVGSICGIAAGSSPSVQSAILMDDSYFRSFFDIANNLGKAYLPTAVLVLGGSIVQNNESTTPKSDWKTYLSSGSQLRTIATLFGTRFVLSPMIAFAIVKFFCMTNLVEDVRTQASMPPAQNSIILLQLSDRRDRANSMAKLLSLMYAISAIPVTILISFSLASSDIMQFQQ
jgi:predicted permease